ncbi:MAG: hypothetical protein APF81_21485 [Desulfosporosinus sp. BRH_c37]|nr:MAG: hypothetical protein APF81_21485 [Desulfosporosinus sp. BRH_c37]
MILYHLAKQVTLHTEPNGGSLFISHPQRIIKLSSGGVVALGQLCGQDQALVSGIDPRIKEFAVNLENQGVIVRQFPPMSEELLPFVSIVIPTYDRPQKLISCLNSLLTLDYPIDKLEIIIVDDASPIAIDLTNLINQTDQEYLINPTSQADKTDQIKGVTEIRLIRLVVNKGPGEARNHAVQAARGEIIAFLDDDCLVDKDWLRALVPCFQYPDVAIVGGCVEAADLTNSLGQYEQGQSPLFMGEFQRKVRKGSAVSYLPTCNLLIRKTNFLALGGFDPNLRLGEDVDLCWRVLDSGANIYYLPAGVVYHDHRARLLSFLKRRYNYGQSEAKLQGKHRQEKRQLSLFPGHGYLMAITIITTFLAGLQFGTVKGLFFGIVVLFFLGFLNLLGQVALSRYRTKAAGYSLPFSQVWRATRRAHNSSLYIYCQHFSRYYSIVPTILVLPFFSPLFLLLLFIHSWPAVVDYTLKRPAVAPIYFILYYSLENYFYQAGVLNGCWQEHNWRPLVMDLTNVKGVGR